MDLYIINIDLLFRVEVYFYRIQKNALNLEGVKKLEIEKYFGRILTDLMLIKGEIKFQEMHKYHYTHIIYDKLKSTKIIDNTTKDLIVEFVSNGIMDIDFIGEIVGDLYKQYLKIRTEVFQ